MTRIREEEEWTLLLVPQSGRGLPHFAPLVHRFLYCKSSVLWYCMLVGNKKATGLLWCSR